MHPRPVVTEHRARGVVHIPVWVVAPLLHHLLGVVAGAVSVQAAREPPSTLGIGSHLAPVVPHLGHRQGPGEHRRLPSHLGALKLSAHALHIGHGPAHALPRHLQAEGIPGLQQDGLPHHQTLADGPVGGLTEVASLGMLQVALAGEQGQLQIGDGRPGEHPHMLALHQVCENEPLPVAVQHVLGAHGVNLQPRPPLQRLQEQVHLGVVAQGLKVPHTFHRLGQGLQVDDAAGAEGDIQVETAAQLPLQHLPVHLAHEFHPHLLCVWLPLHLQLGVLLLQAAQPLQQGGGVHPLRGNHLIGEHRLQPGAGPVLLCPQALPRRGVGEPGHSAHRPGGGHVHRGEFGPGVEANLVDLLLPVGSVEHLPHPQLAPGNFQPGKPLTPLIPGDFKDPGPEVLGPLRFQGIGLDAVQQLLHPLHLEGGAEVHREQLPLHHQGRQLLLGKFLPR